MNKTFALLLVLILSTSTVIASLPASAEYGTARTIVVPDDYSKISDAIANATEGDTILIKKGVYQEQTLTINKTLQIRGEKAANTILHFHPSLIFGGYLSLVPYYFYDSIIKINSNDVQLSDLTISYQESDQEPADLAKHTLGPTKPKFSIVGGAEITVKGNRTEIKGNIFKALLSVEGFYQTIVENKLINGVTCSGSNNQITSNIVAGSGIGVGGFSNQIYANNIEDVRKNKSGIAINGYQNIIAENHITRCDSALVVYSLYGVGTDNVLYGNTMARNVYGITVAGGTNNTFVQNQLIDNSVAIVLQYSTASEGTAAFYHNNFIGSIEQVKVSTSVTKPEDREPPTYNTTGYFDNGRQGNYWSDYTGLDTDEDGIGDTPYIIDSNHQDNHPLMLPFDISSPPLPLQNASPEPSQLKPSPNEPSQKEPFPTIAVATASLAITGIIGVALTFHFRCRSKRLTH